MPDTPDNTVFRAPVMACDPYDGSVWLFVRGDAIEVGKPNAGDRPLYSSVNNSPFAYSGGNLTSWPNAQPYVTPDGSAKGIVVSARGSDGAAYTLTRKNGVWGSFVKVGGHWL